MQLVIDVGNTRIKAALFEDEKILQTFFFDSISEFISSSVIQNYSPENSIVASVIDDIQGLIENLKQKMSVLVFDSNTPVPIKNLYKTPATLGRDRLAAAIGGNCLYPDTDLLVVDCGTCIKYDFVNHQNEYIGGAIAPGLQMRFKALQTFTDRLPLMDLDEELSILTGRNTAESIRLGVQSGAVAEVDGIIQYYKEQYPALIVMLSGGDMNFFAKRLKNSIFADQNLILKGLNQILAYNLNRI
jgi:type III pantothenate kinase